MTFLRTQCILKFFNSDQWLWSLVHVFCICIFFAQLGQLLPNYFAPSTTKTEVSDVQLKDVDFPLNIKVCVKPGFNRTALKDIGYRDEADFILGRSIYNRYGIIGWGGNTKGGKAKTSAKEVFDEAKTKLKNDHFDRISLTTHAGDKSGNLLKDLSLENINLVSPCYNLNLNNITRLVKNGIRWVNIFLHGDKIAKNNWTIEVKLQEQSLVTAREIVEHRFYSKGDAMKLDFGSLKLLKYIVKLKEDIFVEEDPRNDCRNYPNSDFASYKECDSKYLTNRVKDLGKGLDLMPPWIVDDFESILVRPVFVPNKTLGLNCTKLTQFTVVVFDSVCNQGPTECFFFFKYLKRSWVFPGSFFNFCSGLSWYLGYFQVFWVYRVFPLLHV